MKSMKEKTRKKKGRHGKSMSCRGGWVNLPGDLPSLGLAGLELFHVKALEKCVDPVKTDVPYRGGMVENRHRSSHNNI